MIRKAGLGARISVPAALAAGLAAPLLAMALAAPAWAATGPRMGSAGQTGFVVTGAQIRDVRGQVFGRNGAGFASTQAGIGGSLSLWAGGNRGTVILVGVLIMWGLIGAAGLAAHVGARLWPDCAGANAWRGMLRGCDERRH